MNEICLEGSETLYIGLENYIKLNGWEPIGNPESPFTGSFNGSKYKINHLHIGFFKNKGAGLFGCVSSGARLKNIRIKNATINSSGLYAGGIAGILESGSIQHCHVNGEINGRKIVGGIVGSIKSRGKVDDCSLIATVGGITIKRFVSPEKADDEREDCKGAGGVAGENHGTIINCKVYGKIVADFMAGGIAGGNLGKISNSHANIKIKTGESSGGFAGGNSGNISCSSVQCDIEGDRFLGGFVGLCKEGTIHDCFSIGRLKGEAVVGGFIGSNAHKISTSFAAVNIDANYYFGGFLAVNEVKDMQDCYYYKDLAQCEDITGCNPISFHDIVTENTFKNWDFENTWIMPEGGEFPWLEGATFDPDLYDTFE